MEQFESKKQTLHSHLASKVRYISHLSHTPNIAEPHVASNVRYIALQRPKQFLEMLKSNFFRGKTLTSFIIPRPKNQRERPMRSPTQPSGLPLRPRKFSLRHINFPRCFVKQWFFCPFFHEKRGENPVFTGLLLFARTKIQHFPPKSKSL